MGREIGCLSKKPLQMAFVLTIVFLLIIGCKPKSSSLFILAKPTCSYPCWQNIYPGKSTQQEAISILKELPAVDTGSIVEHGGSWSIFDDRVFATFQTESIKAEIYIVDHKVVWIVLSGNLNTTFGQAVRELGEPKYVINIPMSVGLPLSPTSSYAIIALDPKQGISFSYDTRNLEKNLQSEIKPEVKLNLITFFDPGAYERILEAGLFAMGKLNAGDTRFYMKPWVGYGPIVEKYPPAVLK